MLKIEIRPSELEAVESALGRSVTVVTVASRTRKVERERLPRLTERLVGPFPLGHTTPELDAWLSRNASRETDVARKPKPPKPAALKPKKWTKADIATAERFASHAVRAWKDRGYSVFVTGGAPKVDGSNVVVTRKDY